MTRKSARPQRQRRSDGRREIPVPHSSWSRVQRVANGATLAPDDFWARLGL